ncbi:MAG: sigma-54-dependent Fis family transcriptional regulator [Chitinispirillaceae bacterium]|nr:sigma-54-dependent Fis family transcriptional regulator [Chitinispirillaceae bacterium]
MGKKKILVVDDNELFRDSIADTLVRLGFEVTQAPDGSHALEAVAKDRFDLMISDMKMPGMTGIELLEKIKQNDPDMPFLIITAFGAVETAVEAMKKGAYDFIQKSGSLMRELELTVIRALQYQTLLNENRQLKSALSRKWSYIGKTPVMEEVRALVEKIADSRATVLVTGESGTGKELVARSIHFSSRRNNGPFVKVNCAALPEGLVESELFGHEKGAFTGAIMQKRGKFEAASGGTLLLDEIGEMPLPAQAKLLRVLQEHEIHKVGGDEPIEVDVRIVVTTNRKLEEEVAKGAFREDLYYRLNVLRIHLPPLRERREDIPALAEHFLRNCNEENGFSVECPGDECMAVLQKYPWPGNIRELQNAMERAVVLTRTGKIQPAMFQFRSPLDFPRPGQDTLEAGMTVAEAEKKLILKTLDYCSQNRTKAAEMLAISIRTLRNKLNEYQLDAH